MYGDPSHASSGEPLPPVRTRWGSAESRIARGGSPLGPVRSGLFGSATTPSVDDYTETIEVDALEIEETIEIDVTLEVDASLDIDTPIEIGERVDFGAGVDFGGQPFDGEPEPWTMRPEPAAWESDRVEDDEGLELLLDLALEDAEDDGSELDATPAHPTLASPDPFTQFLDAAEALRAGPAPLSPWQVGREAKDTDDDPHAGRRAHEWDSFGKALADSLASPGPNTFGAMDLGLESAPDPARHHGVTEPGVEGLQPIGADLQHAKALEPDAAGAPEVLAELAERLERFAAGIRTEGHYAISRAQLSGDRMDAMLAGFAAGWLAARGQ